MLGFIPLTCIVIFLALIKGTIETSTILSPILFLTVSVPVISFLIPDLDCVTVASTVSVVLLLMGQPRPALSILFELANTVSRPVPFVCQSLNCVPKLKPTKLSHASFSPWILTITSGLVVVSIQLSLGGVKSTVPTQANTAKGLTLIALLATVWLTNAVVVYGRVTQSPVFCTPEEDPVLKIKSVILELKLGLKIFSSKSIAHL